MKLSKREFNAMNNPVRRWFQRLVEYPNFKRMGLDAGDKAVLEIGCGSGYGALLISEMKPRSYEGVDLMPEQIELAHQLADEFQLDSYVFRVQDATDLSNIQDASKDVVVIFGILHHIPGWRTVIAECERVLREGGKLFVEEPDGRVITAFDRLFHWGHPDNGQFSIPALEQSLTGNGMKILKKVRGLGFGVFAAQK